jgi:hypothetical protein
MKSMQRCKENKETIKSKLFAWMDFPRCLRPSVTFSSLVNEKCRRMQLFISTTACEERPRKALYSEAFILVVDLVLRKVVASSSRRTLR